MARGNAQCDPAFRPLLSGFAEGALENTAAIVYGVWSDLTLAYLNPAWFAFAAKNQGEPTISRDWTLGRSILPAIPSPILPFFQTHYARCVGETRPWEHVYECSSPDSYRKFHMKAFPLGDAEGLLFVNSLVTEFPVVASGETPCSDPYVTRHGFAIQCCHCRRFRRGESSMTWDWIGAWVKQTPVNVSHGICETCFGFYYADSRLDSDHPQIISTLDL